MSIETADERALRRYGQEIRRLRNESELTLEGLARRADSSRSQLSDVERGVTRPSARLRHALDDAIGHGRLNRLWEDLTGDGREAWRYEVAELMETASVIYHYQVLVFPPYLQTERYAQAVVQYGAPWLSSEEVQKEVQSRTDRVERLKGGTRPKIWLVIDETILGRRYGGAGVMHDQLTQVADLMERELVTVQMVRSDELRHPGNSGSFILISAPKAPEALFTESAREGQLSTNYEHLRRFRMLFAALQGVAVGRDETLSAIRDEIERLKHA